jgi:hypothetical protein
MKKRIVIASVLKPVSDTRMTEKIAATLSGDDELDVHVIGYPAEFPNQNKITFHQLDPFERLSFGRVIKPLKVLELILQLKPSVLIITTHELLLTVLIAKLFSKIKVVYDVQENYYLNIRYTNAFPKVFRFPIAAYVRIKERLASIFIDHFFLAEEIYRSQLPFLRNRYTVLENKALNSSGEMRQIQNPYALVFSGTLSKTTGVFKAISLAEELQKIEQAITLTIIGCAAMKVERDDIIERIKGNSFIKLIGGDVLVPHPMIMETLTQSGAGIISYEDNPATTGRIPTKLFEYLALNLPIILYSNDRNWEALASRNGRAIHIINPSLDAKRVHEWIQSDGMPATPVQDVFWKSEQIKLKTVISSL